MSQQQRGKTKTLRLYTTECKSHFGGCNSSYVVFCEAAEWQLYEPHFAGDIVGICAAVLHAITYNTPLPSHPLQAKLI